MNSNNLSSKTTKEQKDPKPTTTTSLPKPKQVTMIPEAVLLSHHKSPPKLPSSPNGLCNIQRQQLNEEQTSKTKKLLSDLNSKRRSRQRKQIMVVNTSNNQSPRNGLGLMMMPGKLSLNMDLNQIACQLNISPLSSNSNSVNEIVPVNVPNNQIVCSG